MLNFRNEKFVSVYKGYCRRVNYPGRASRGWVNPTEIPLMRPIVQHLREIALEEEDLIDDCKKELTDVKSHIPCKWTKIMNPHGVCYTMNMIDSEDLFHHGV